MKCCWLVIICISVWHNKPSDKWLICSVYLRIHPSVKTDSPSVLDETSKLSYYVCQASASGTAPLFVFWTPTCEAFYQPAIKLTRTPLFHFNYDNGGWGCFLCDMYQMYVYMSVSGEVVWCGEEKGRALAFVIIFNTVTQSESTLLNIPLWYLCAHSYEAHSFCRVSI